MTRSIRLQAWIYEVLKDKQDHFVRCKNNLYEQNSSFIPPQANTYIESAHNHLRLYLVSILNNKDSKTHYNLTELQRSVIKQTKNIIIMDTNKNLGMVVMKRENYIKSILKEDLLQPNVYKQLSYLQVHHEMRQNEIERKKHRSKKQL